MEQRNTSTTSSTTSPSTKTEQTAIPSSSKGWIVGILIVVLLLLVGYTVTMYELYKSRKFIFSPYTPPPPPGKTFYPLGGVTKLTADEIAARNATVHKNSPSA